jgi:hypothetical protein
MRYQGKTVTGYWGNVGVPKKQQDRLREVQLISPALTRSASEKNAENALGIGKRGRQFKTVAG